MTNQIQAELRRLHRVSRENDRINFMAFWRTFNIFAATRDLPEIQYGEAKELFDIYLNNTEA